VRKLALWIGFIALGIICLGIACDAQGNPGVAYITMRVSAYCPCEICCGTGSPGITASGHVIQEGDRFVAAPKEIPFGTWIRIPGYNGNEPVRVEDRGGAIKGARLDVFFPTHQEALDFGVQYIRVEVAL